METDGGSRSDREGLVTLETIAKEVEADTQPELCEFSEPARSAIHRLIIEYAQTLVHAAIAAKNRVKGDSVSKANVEEAAVNLRRQDGQMIEKLAGIGGGLFVGTALSTMASMIQDGAFTPGGTIISVLAGVGGAFLIALQLSEGLLSSLRRHKPPS